jgi:hypothetical protein
MRANIRLSLVKLFPVQLLALLDNVITKLTGNTNFTNLPKSVEELGTLRDAFKAAIEEATDGSVSARKKRDQMVLEVRDALRANADHQRAQAKGNAAILSTGGFTLAKVPEPLNEVGVPGKLLASATDAAGEVMIRWSKTPGARMYRVDQAASDPAAGETAWKALGLISRHRFLVKGLKSYEACWFRITAIGIESEGLPSDVVMGRAA